MIGKYNNPMMINYGSLGVTPLPLDGSEIWKLTKLRLVVCY